MPLRSSAPTIMHVQVASSLDLVPLQRVATILRALRTKEVRFFDGEAYVVALDRRSGLSPYGEPPDTGTEPDSSSPSVPF